MPAGYTHAEFGKQVLQNLKPEIQVKINQHIDLYNIGLHGPDILFFYKPLSSNEINRYGYWLHEQSADTFFLAARKIIKMSKDPEAALVYILGFINHFVLDSECHPYINQFVEDSQISHSEVESEIDRSLMVLAGLDPVKTKTTGHLKVKEDYGDVIGPFFGFDGKTINKSIKTMITIMNLFVIPSSMKRNVIFAIMRLLGRYESLHGLVINYQPNSNCMVCSEENLKRFQRAVPIAVQLITEYVETLSSEDSLDLRYQENYE